MILTSEAATDLMHAYRHYEAESAGLGEDFFECVGDVLDRIERFPEIYAIVSGDARCAIPRRFPYLILYRIVDQEIIILAITHSKRHPRRWQDRLN